MSASTNTMKYIIVLPCMGSPYIWKNKVFSTKTKDGKTALLNELKTVVRGCVEPFVQEPSCRYAFIHPMFQKENSRWAVADKLLKCKDARVYVNGDSCNECSPNMACLIKHKDISKLSDISMEIVDALPMTVAEAPLFGEVAIVVSVPDLQKVCAPDALKLVCVKEFEKKDEEEEEEDDESETEDEAYERFLNGYIYEPDDEEDEEAMIARAKERGWDYIPSCGQVYMQKVLSSIMDKRDLGGC